MRCRPRPARRLDQHHRNQEPGAALRAWPDPYEIEFLAGCTVLVSGIVRPQPEPGEMSLDELLATLTGVARERLPRATMSSRQRLMGACCVLPVFLTRSGVSLQWTEQADKQNGLRIT